MVILIYTNSILLIIKYKINSIFFRYYAYIFDDQRLYFLKINYIFHAGAYVSHFDEGRTWVYHKI